jgi:hypothetical protein
LGDGLGVGATVDTGTERSIFIEFAPVQPDAAAFRAVVNLRTSSFGHDQVGFITYRILHTGHFILVFGLGFSG